MNDPPSESARPAGGERPKTTAATLPPPGPVVKRSYDPGVVVVIDRLPPHSEEMERLLLGCCVADPKHLRKLVARFAGCQPFYMVRHATLFDLLRQQQTEGKPFDSYIIAERFRSLDQGPDAFSWVTGLQDKVPSAANVDYYLAEVWELYQRRRIIQTAAEWQELLSDRNVAPETALNAIQDCVRFLKADTGCREQPQIEDATALLSADLEAPSELVQGLLHRGSKLVLGGGSKSFKTWALLDIGVSVATGEPWLSFATKRARVLYVNLELQEYFIRGRLQAICEAKSLHLPPGCLSIWNLRGHAAAADKLLPRIAEAAGLNFGLIILDPIYKLLGDSDENSARDIAALLNALERLAEHTGAAVAFGAHYSKGNQASKTAIDRISGSGVFARDPDSILTFTRHEEADAFTVEATLRNFPPIDRFCVRWAYPLLRRDDGLDPAKLKQVTLGRQPVYSPEQLLAALGKRALAPGAWEKRAKEETGMSHGKFWELLHKLEAEKRITKDAKGRWSKACCPECPECPEST